MHDRRGSGGRFSARGHNKGRGGGGGGGGGHGFQNDGGRGRNRFDPHDQPPPPHSRNSRPATPEDTAHRPSATSQSKGEERKATHGDDVSLRGSRQGSVPQEQGSQADHEMPPPSWTAPKECPQAQSQDSRPFKRVFGLNANRGPASSESKGESNFRPFALGLSKNKKSLPKALDSSRGLAGGASAASGSNNIPLGKTVEALKKSAKREAPASSNPDPPTKPADPPKPPAAAGKVPPTLAKETSIYNRLSMVGEGTYG